MTAKNINAATLAGLLLVFGIGTYADELKCPSDFTDDSLEEFRDSAIETMNSGNYGVVKDLLGTCFQTVGFPKCMQALAETLKLKSGGWPRLDDMDTMNESDTSFALHSEKDLPKEFASSETPGVFNIPPNIADLAKQKGWKLISYKTRSTGGFDTPPNLTLIAIPGKEKDIFIQISPPPDPNAHATANDPKPQSDISHGQSNATIITVDKTQDPPLGQLRLMRGGPEGYRWSNTLSSQRCIQCHSAPLRSISPRGFLVTNGDEKRMSPEDETTVKQINGMMLVDHLSWGSTSVNGQKVRRGPTIDSHPYGWAPSDSKTRKPDFIKSCAASANSLTYRSIHQSSEDDIYNVRFEPHEMAKIDAGKVAVNMNCVQCHNGGIRGPLSREFSLGEIQFKVMVDRSMPPGANLTTDERLALVNCLSAEYSAVESDWRKAGEWMTKDGCQTMHVHRARSSSEPSSSQDPTSTH